MTDIEIIKKCADRMDYKVALDIHGTFFFVTDGTKQPERHDYNPLTDDAQAMALVKKFGLIIEPDGVMPTTEWWVQVWVSDEIRCTGFANKDLNRAICECVARLP